MLLPPEIFKYAAPCVLRYWEHKGEFKYISYFKKNHVAINGGWMMGRFAFGICNNNQAIERNHREVAKLILKYVKREGARCKLPISVAVATKALFSSVIKEVSQQEAVTSFETFPEISPP